MNEHFTVFIDESGEAGIEKIRSASSKGASPYMTLGASVISSASADDINGLLEKVRGEIGKRTLHCSSLKHFQLLHLIRSLNEIRSRHFGVISRKGTLGTYREEIEADSGKYYNKCVQYLLERVGWFMESRRIPKKNLSIVFECANIDYEKMTYFLSLCQSKPRRPATKKLVFLDLDNISIRKKKEEPLLQLADLTAHVLYKCVDKEKRHHGIPEPRYIVELGPKFFGNPETNQVVGAGLYCVHSTADLQLDSDVETALKGLIALPPN